MRLFRRHRPNDLIYLTPIQLGNEQVPGEKIRMLYCDSKGKVLTAIIENSVYELAKSHAEQFKHANKDYAIISLEIAPSESVPLAVGINPEQVTALERILEHAVGRGVVPDILKKYVKDIIRIGEPRREELKSLHKWAWNNTYSGKTLEALQRLSYYPEDHLEVTMPIYKAQCHYPLIVLKRLTPDELTPSDMQKLLTLDNDGDLVIVRVRLETIDEAERNLEEWERINNLGGCIVCSRHQNSFAINHMEVSELQRKALKSIPKGFEETGFIQQPISADAITVLSRAKQYLP
ncbi:MAG: hypothetical protein IMY88_01000 [Chloroflexi bacterium]|nr:hypothetical protein [Chloroflexota bacterium]